MKRFSSQGQLNFEYVILTGVLLAILIPVVYTSLSTFNEYYKTTRIDDVLSQVVHKADDLYKLGPGNKDVIKIIVPSGITGATIIGNEVALEATLGKQQTTVRKYADADLIGSLQTIQGEYLVPIRVINQTLVRIGSGPWILDIDPACIVASAFADPPNITVHGDDFTSTSVLLKDGVAFNSAYYSVVDPGTLTFIAHPTEFPIQPSG
ncbi:MAG: hypothetical protein Q8L34_04775, partial [Candidatus Woesearchaeota archaeon]|nr:hypothetical protein [Candidatus Woesearchaeota archaeon]